VYLGAGAQLAEGYRDENLPHDQLLLQRGDSVNIVIDLGFLQFVKRNSRRVPMIGVIPHAVGPSD
jgi:hypothetical protein